MDIAIRTVVGSAMATINALGQSLIIVSETFLLLLFGIILLALNPVLTITSLVYLIIVIFCINILLSKRITQFGEELGKLRISIQSRILETLKLRREILLLGRERFFYEGVSKQFEYQARSFSGDIWLQQTPKYIIEISLMLGTFGFISILLLTDNNVVGIPVLVIFLASASRIFPSLLRIQNSLLNLKSFNYLSGGAIELSERLMSRTHSQLPANFDKKIYKESRGAHTKIELKDVSFNHQGMNDPLFDGLNCTIEPGEKIALIGPSGSGKTTFINLILGFHKISGGSLKIGGINCEEWIALNPAKIGYVPQDFHFVSGTLLENICLGIYEDSIDYHKLAEAMHKSNLTQFVNSLPQGIKTFMGPHGQSFSGGQKQRILLARALYDRPEILVLDEGTSSLDAETESVIVSNILNETSSQTVLFVAHRLSAIRSFARILYFENGRIYADGSFDYLVDTIPEFSLQLKLLGIID
jgi:ABC-type multidrug transport system fused ATPase/permease subunit